VLSEILFYSRRRAGTIEVHEYMYFLLFSGESGGESMLEAGVRSSDYTFEFSRYIQAGSNSGSRDNDCICLGTDVLWLTDPII